MTTPLPKLDSRYSIRAEFTGHRSAKPRLVARFCGTWIGEAPNRREARALCLAHRRKFLASIA